MKASLTRKTQDSIMKKTEEHIEDTHGESEGLIKTPKQLIVTVILAFIVPIVTILLLVSLVETTTHKGQGSDAQTAEAIANRALVNLRIPDLSSVLASFFFSPPQTSRRRNNK